MGDSEQQGEAAAVDGGPWTSYFCSFQPLFGIELACASDTVPSSTELSRLAIGWSHRLSEMLAAYVLEDDRIQIVRVHQESSSIHGLRATTPAPMRAVSLPAPPALGDATRAARRPMSPQPFAAAG